MMRASTPAFTLDTMERAAKTVFGAFTAYVFESWLGTLVELGIVERGLVFAAGTLAFSVAGSLISRRFGTPGTASLTNSVDYGAL